MSCNVRKSPSPFQLNNLFKGLSLDLLHIPRSYFLEQTIPSGSKTLTGFWLSWNK